jgi:hypothetical protein
MYMPEYIVWKRMGENAKVHGIQSEQANGRATVRCSDKVPGTDLF